MTELGNEGERYSYPHSLNKPGFFEDAAILSALNTHVPDLGSDRLIEGRDTPSLQSLAFLWTVFNARDMVPPLNWKSRTAIGGKAGFVNWLRRIHETD